MNLSDYLLTDDHKVSENFDFFNYGKNNNNNIC